MNTWKEEKLGNLVAIKSGYSPSSYLLTNKGTYPFVKVEDLNNCNRIQQAAREYCSEGKGAIPAGSVIFPKRGAAITNNKVRIVGRPLLLDSNMMALIPKQHKIASSFLFYLLVSEKLHKIADTSTIPQINNKHILPYPVLIPPFIEQVAISEKFEIWDSAIDLTERLIATKQERHSWLVQQLFTGNRRLPGFEEPWETVHLGNAFTNRVEINHPDLPLIAITGSGGVVSREDLVRRDTSSEDKRKYLRICPGDIGYNTMRMWQGVCGLSQFEGIVSPAYTIITPKDEVDGEFMALLFKSLPVIHLFHRHSQGLVDDTLNLKWRHFSEIKVTIPENVEQKAIAAVFRTADRELDLLRSQLNAFREQKKGLMQQLLTGKVRVKV